MPLNSDFLPERTERRGDEGRAAERERLPSQMTAINVVVYQLEADFSSSINSV